MTHAVVRAQLSGYRMLATGDLRISFDVPHEHAADAVTALFGDGPGQEVAVARLAKHRDAVGDEAGRPATVGIGLPKDELTGSEVATPKLVQSQHPPKPRKPWHELRPSQQAGIRCGDPDFQRWMGRYLNGGETVDVDGAAEYVREFCGVKSRAEIDTNDSARDAWRRLDTRFQEANGLVAEQRL